MIQIKVFEGDSEEKINKWLKDNDVIDAKISRRDCKTYYPSGEIYASFVETLIVYKKYFRENIWIRGGYNVKKRV